MKLFNKAIDNKLFKQYALGSDLSKQEVVAKIFNPQGAQSWFILNSDPEDPDYLWAIVDLGYGAEIGSVSRNELESYRGRFGLGFERDLSFDPINAKELYEGLRGGKYYAKGGEVSFIDYKDCEIMYEPHYKKYYANDVEFDSLKEAQEFIDSGEIDPSIRDAYSKGLFADGGDISEFSDNQRMIMNQNVELEHHHEELEDILEDEMPVPAWVVAKMATATNSVSDVTHYLDGQKELMEDESEEEDEDEDEQEEEYGEFDYSTLDPTGASSLNVVEPINVSAGTKAELTKKFTEDAWGNLRGFLKGMEGIDLRNDYTFDYKNEQFEVEPIINSDENGVSNAVFTIFDGDGEEVGEVAYSREGGKQKFTANSDYFQWNDAKFEDGGYFDGTIPNVSSYMSTYAKGGETNFRKDLTNKEVYDEVKLKVGNSIWEQNSLNILRNESIKNPDSKFKPTGDLDKLQKYLSYSNSYAKGGSFDEWRKGSTVSFSTKKQASERLSLMEKSNETDADFRNLRVEKTSNGYAVKFDFKDKMENGGFMSNVYAKGGEIAKAEILGLSKNIMGTTDIEMKITGMRKPQDFIVYPIGKDDAGNVITIQSDTRIGQINLVKGVGVMSQSHSNGAYFVHLQMDKLTSFTISESDLEDLKAYIFKTSGANVGTRGVVTDNSGASGVYAKGGSVKKDWWHTVVNPNEDFNNFDDKMPIDWDVDDFKSWVVSNSDLDGNADKEVLDVVKIPKSKLTVEYLNKNGSGENNNEFYKKYGNWQSALYDIFTQMKKDYLFKKSLKYILKADIKTVTVKTKNGKEVTYSGADVLNGNYVLAKGGDITSKATYFGKNNVVEVELKDGSKVKPANGYWVKKGAEPIGAEPTPTTSGKSEPKISTTEIRKDARGNWRAETNVENFNGYDWRISTVKTYTGNLVSSAQGGKSEDTSSRGVRMFMYTMYQDPHHTLEVSKPKRLTDKVVSEQHDKALAKFKKFMETGMFKSGGKISNFDKLSAKVAKEYEGKPVKSQYQEEYGRYYSKEEAQEVGDKVAGKVKAMQTDSKAFGGLFSGAKKMMTPVKYPDLEGKQVALKTGKFVQVFSQSDDVLSVLEVGKVGSGERPHSINISEVDMDSFKSGGKVGTKKTNSGSETLKQANDLAKKIRMDGESWLDAKRRAFAQLKK
jgi:hypothetical protein